MILWVMWQKVKDQPDFREVEIDAIEGLMDAAKDPGEGERKTLSHG